MQVNQGTMGNSLNELTAENYNVPANEKHLYHCIIEVKKFNPETGERLSVPRLQKFGVKMFENGVADNLKRQGYTITILHNPHGNNAPQLPTNVKTKRGRK